MVDLGVAVTIDKFLCVAVGTGCARTSGVTFLADKCAGLSVFAVVVAVRTFSTVFVFIDRAVVDILETLDGPVRG